jgi:phosphate starvation-inducible PhoH-like protein
LDHHVLSLFHIYIFYPKTDHQKDALQSYSENDVTILLGPAGTGKTFVSVAIALQELVHNQRESILLTRPAVEAGENLGFLPGDLYEKLDPYIQPLNDCMDKMLGKNGPGREKYKNQCKIVPLAFMRGKTFDKTVCILDEAQNCTLAQLTMFLSRIGEGSKMIITGDPEQSDLRGPNAFAAVVRVLTRLSGVGIVKFDEADIVRHPIIGKILKRIKTIDLE